MPTRIHVITPITSVAFRGAEDFQALETDDVRITQEFIEKGPASIESEFDEAMAQPDTLRKVAEAEESGADAIVIDCLGDPAVKAAREIVSIPVIGPGETSMHWAALLGGPFSVVTVLDSVRPLIENIAATNALQSKMKSVRVVSIPVLELDKDQDRLFQALGSEAVEAVRADGARAIILGCTGMNGCSSAIEDELNKQTGAYVPVIDPVPAAILQAIATVKLGVRQSKLTYAPPPDKPLSGYEFPKHNRVAAE